MKKMIDLKLLRRNAQQLLNNFYLKEIINSAYSNLINIGIAYYNPV